MRGKTGVSQTACRKLKGIVKITVLLIIFAALIACSMHLPYLKAYFMDEIIYSSRHAGERTLMRSGLDVVSLSYEVRHFDNLATAFELDSDNNILLAAISLQDLEECGFTAADVIGGSLRLTSDVGGQFVLPPHFETNEGRLTMIFAWDEIVDILGAPESDLILTISGRGIGHGPDGLSERFTFSGYGSLSVPLPEEPGEPEDPEDNEAIEEPLPGDQEPAEGDDAEEETPPEDGDGDSDSDEPDQNGDGNLSGEEGQD